MRGLRKPTSPPLNLKFFLKSTRPSFIDKAGCTRQFESELSLRSFAQPFPSGDKGCANRPTRSSNRYAIRLADHQRSTPAAELRFLCGMNPPSLKDLLRGCLLVAFFENLPVLLLLIKRAALGNMKANFHCAHLHNLSPQGTGDVPTALSIVFTTPSVPLVGDRNGAQTATL